jgi:hypothetical protein
VGNYHCPKVSCCYCRCNPNDDDEVDFLPIFLASDRFLVDFVFICFSEHQVRLVAESSDVSVGIYHRPQVKLLV